MGGFPGTAPVFSPDSSPQGFPGTAPVFSPDSSPQGSPTAVPTKAPVQAPTKAPVQAPTKPPTAQCSPKRLNQFVITIRTGEKGNAVRFNVKKSNKKKTKFKAL